MIHPSRIRFLIDECLTIDLVEVATGKGFIRSVHVNHRGLTGCSDNRPTKYCLENDYTFVTANGKDFRSRPGSKSTRPCYADVELHAGLVCLNLKDKMNRQLQVEYFEAALNFTRKVGDLTNQCVEVDKDPAGSSMPLVSMYELPAGP